MTNDPRGVLTEAEVAQYRAEGFCVLPSVLDAALLDLLLDESDAAIANVHRQMDERGVDVLGGNRRGLQYVPGNCRQAQPRLREFLFGDLIRAICAPLIGPSAYLVWEQYSIKFGAAPGQPAGAAFARDGNPQSLGRFSWHQDSGYVPRDHEPYLTCWVALDDSTAENGALRIIPFSELGVRTRVTHVPDPHNGDLVGYFGSQAGTLVEVKRGSIVCFSSTTFHSSGTNDTALPRRAFLAQYSPTVDGIDGAPLWTEAEPLVADAARPAVPV